MSDDTTFPFISKADISKARELIEQETGMFGRTLTPVGSIFDRLGPLGEAIVSAEDYERWAAKGEASLVASSPWVLTKIGRIQDLTDEDLEGFEFDADDDDEWEIEFETFGSDPGDMAVMARAYLNMTPDERADFDKDRPDARSELRAFIDSLDDEP